jgi:hypothetical protein
MQRARDRNGYTPGRWRFRNSIVRSVSYRPGRFLNERSTRFADLRLRFAVAIRVPRKTTRKSAPGPSSVVSVARASATRDSFQVRGFVDGIMQMLYKQHTNINGWTLYY